MEDIYTNEEREIIDSFETVDIVLRAYFEKEINNDNLREAEIIDNLLYDLRHMKNRIANDFIRNH